MFIGMAIVFIGLVAIIWPAAYALTTLAYTIVENRRRKKDEARKREYEARDRQAREARAKIWDKRFSEMSQEEYEEFMNCLFT